MNDQNRILDLAKQIVLHTDSCLYLTGKAGSGKTTFLKYINEHTTKRIAITAPTGIAAINAGGVTLHSFFQLPFGIYVPFLDNNNFSESTRCFDKKHLLGRMRLSKERRDTIKFLQTLIIDEVSMLRADTLDAIDAVLKSVRRNQAPFGGVQMVFIGDMYQLAPVVRDDEKSLFETFYDSPYFFDAKSFNQSNAFRLELTKIYRQSHQEFIDLLNNIRNNTLSQTDYELLASRYKPNALHDLNHTITLTTHNYKADQQNNAALDCLPSKLFTFSATVKGEFPEHSYPTELNLQLKVGAQVMFVKNDTQTPRRYFNGKIAIVKKIDDDVIVVTCPESNKHITVSVETWNNVKYLVNTESGTLEEQTIGSFEQFPLRLAWAITIHKSQGLTFEKTIIDAGQSFTLGQVYVALSRCTTLDGVFLKTPIHSDNIYTDLRIHEFSAKSNEDQLEEKVQKAALDYEQRNIKALFDLNDILLLFHDWEQLAQDTKHLPEKLDTDILILEVSSACKNLNSIGIKFSLQLNTLFDGSNINSDDGAIKERLQKGLEYFAKALYTEIIHPIQSHIEQVKNMAKLKKYREEINKLLNLLWLKMDNWRTANYKQEQLCANIEWPSRLVKNITPEPKKEKVIKGNSAKESLHLFKEGKSIEEVAVLRNLAPTTIESHLSQFVKTGELPIHTFFSDEQIKRLTQLFETTHEPNLTNIKVQVGDDFTFGELRMMQSYIMYKASLEKTTQTVNSEP